MPALVKTLGALVTLGLALWTTLALGLLALGESTSDGDVVQAMASFGGTPVIVVPGNAVLADGTVGPRLRRRLDRALALAESVARETGVQPWMVTTGGVGTHEPAEAVAAAAYVEAHKSRAVLAGVIVEDVSLTTEGNAVYTARKLEEEAMASRSPFALAIVSDPYHLLRCRWTFARHVSHLDVRSLTTVSPPFDPKFDLHWAFREIPAIAMDLLGRPPWFKGRFRVRLFG